ncbi:MAG TPA: hypothetical protein DEB37_14975 [Lysinibacillus sp.]|uniref:IS3 family transposase n=1 Tax=Lysinibacillus sphaericus TaxID=1421 RepID=UPI0006919532|nr:IS3 family transposase [Lysinibacillus sphaericus]HBT73495.1 hypothetical protein [Lysinibacillus sp.]
MTNKLKHGHDGISWVMHHFKQPVGKQYTFGKGTDGLNKWSLKKIYKATNRGFKKYAKSPIESFQATLKAETFYLDGLIRTKTTIIDQTVKIYIKYYYNTLNQLKLNNQSPINYRKLVG